MRTCEMIVDVDTDGECGDPAVALAFGDLPCCAACALLLLSEDVFVSTELELFVFAPMPRPFMGEPRWLLS